LKPPRERMGRGKEHPTPLLVVYRVLKRVSSDASNYFTAIITICVAVIICDDSAAAAWSNIERTGCIETRSVLCLQLSIKIV
tara:strand:+ start:1253 stop:1498 length:246 start_codon:yes stop_codon:yes gene_type:complete